MTQPHRHHGDSYEPPSGINSPSGTDRDPSGKHSGARRRVDHDESPNTPHEVRDDALPRNGQEEHPGGSSDASLDVPHEEPHGVPHSTPHQAPSEEEHGPSPVASPDDPHQLTEQLEPGSPLPEAVPKVSLRSAAELADALPYLLGFHPDDSVVVVALHGERGRFGGRLRIGIPTEREEWSSVAVQIASCLEGGSRARGEQPDGALVFLCQEPGPGESGMEVMRRLRPLAHRLRLACGRRDMPVFEALCISDGRYFSYCCPDTRCCPPEGKPLAAPGTTAMAAAATYAGLRKPGTLGEMEARLTAVGPPMAPLQERALDVAGAALVPRMLGDDGLTEVRSDTLALAGRLLERFRASPSKTSAWAVADAQDDGLLDTSEAATVILGLQDRKTRDQAAEWMEGQDIGPALRLWRALARRCVGPYAVHAAAPLTLAGWVAWSGGDAPAARVALGRALRADPGYVFAQLLRRACNEGMDPEPLRRCMREEREARRIRRKRESPDEVHRNAP